MNSANEILMSASGRQIELTPNFGKLHSKFVLEHINADHTELDESRTSNAVEEREFLSTVQSVISIATQRLP